MDKRYKRAIKNEIDKLRQGIDFDAYENLLLLCRGGLEDDLVNKHEYKYYMDYIKKIALQEVTTDKRHVNTWRDLYWRTVKVCACHFFEDYLLYMERKRPYEKRFYEPRRKTLKIVVDDLQKLEDSKTQKLYGLSMPSRVGKSTLILFFLSWIVMRRPYSHNAIGTHSGMLANHFYKELLDIFTTDEYTFEELYSYMNPGLEFIADKSAEEMTISFVTKGDFPTITCRGIDGTWTGAVDISGGDRDFGYLCVDDLVRDRTHSLSPKRMNDTFAEYLNKMCDRQNEGSKQLMIGTLWNVMDPLMRLEEMYRDNDDYVFRKIPALNEKNESNFAYEFKGFSTVYYQDMREKLIKAGNEAEWMAKFQQRPYVREGQLFPLDELGYFNGVLPQGHKFRFVVCTDVAFGGGDSVSMPICLHDQTEDIIYVIDWYFSSSGVMVTVPGVVDMIIKHGIKSIIFEANSGGQMYAQKVQEELRKRAYLCSCESMRAPNDASKTDKIRASEGVVKQKFRFLDGTKHKAEEYGEDIRIYERSPQYERALEEMSMFVTMGKVLHDDAPDSIAQVAMRVYDTFDRRAVVMDSPF